MIERFIRKGRSTVGLVVLFAIAPFLASCIEDKAGKWAASDTYVVGDLEFDAPRALVPSISTYPDGDPVQTDLDAPKLVVRRVSLHIEFWSHVSDAEHRDVCLRMDEGWARDLCDPQQREFVKTLPEFDLYVEAYEGMLGSHGTPWSESVLEHFRDMRFEQGPLQVACDRQYIDEDGSKRRNCTVRLSLTASVFAYWRHSFVKFSDSEAADTLNRACDDGRAIHLWFTESLGEVPVYGIDPPKCPSVLSVRPETN